MRRRNSTTWLHGQCGNPGRIRSRPARTMAEIIDTCFAEEVPMRIDGETRRILTFEAIVMILQGKAPTDRHAQRVLRQYQDYALKAGGEENAFEIRLAPDPRHPRRG